MKWNPLFSGKKPSPLGRGFFTRKIKDDSLNYLTGLNNDLVI